MKLTRDFLTQALPEAVYYSASQIVNDAGWERIEKESILVSIDTRTLQPGELFVALKGPQFDGNDFIASALENGACAIVMNEERVHQLEDFMRSYPSVLFILVVDTLQAFINLAKAWRKQLTCTVVGITGSVGKTTTKEMLRSILQAAGINAYVSYKNYNNIFGLCYNILRVPLEASVAVFEVGINECGEMRQLADILRPDIGLITIIGHAHLEGLGNSVQSVSHEKRQLFAFFDSKSIGIICGDQSLLTDVYYHHPVAKFGLKTKNHVQARKTRVECDDQGKFTTVFAIKWYGHKAHIRLHGNHPGYVSNALAASTIAYLLNIQFDAVIRGLESYTGTENRFEMRTLRQGKVVVLNDAYNANPESMKAALLAFGQFKKAGKKVAVLGDMLELGEKEAFWHRQIGRVINKNIELDYLILVGNRARDISATIPFDLKVEFAADWLEAQNSLERYLDLEKEHKSMVLVKASGSVDLVKMVNAISE